MRIKRDKYTGSIEISRGKDLIARFSEENFAELAEAAINFYVGRKEGYRIVSDVQQGKMRGVYLYHLGKNYILSAAHDLKKYVLQRNKSTGNERK